MKAKNIFDQFDKSPLSFIRISIRTKLLLSLIFLLVASLLAIAYFSMRIVEDQFYKMSQDRVEGALRAISTELDLRHKDVVQKLGQTAKIVDLKRKILLRTDDGSPDYAGLALQLNDIKESTGLDLLELCDKDGILLASGHEPGRAGEDRTKDPLFISAMSGVTVVNIVRQQMLSENFLAIKSAVPIEQRGEVIGVLMGGYVLNREYLKRLHRLSAAEVILLRPEAASMSSIQTPSGDDDAGLYIEPDFIKRSLSTKDIKISSFRLKGDYYIAGVHKLKGSNKVLGSMVVLVSNQVIEQTVRELNHGFITVTAVALLLAVLIGYLTARRITRPVQALVDGAVAIAQGNYEQEIPVKGKDEIATLIKAFNYMAHELKDNREKLVTAIKMAEWREVARRIAHEIKNPLTPIALSIENLRRSYRDKDDDLEETFNESTKTILEEVHNLQKIVDEFSAFARMPKLRKEWMDLQELLDSMVFLYENMQDNVKIKIEYLSKIPPLYADCEQLRRAFSNLVRNAIDAMPDGGDLIIQAVEEDKNPPSHYIQLEFIDNGIGISEENLKKMFIPYYSTKQKGTGLGLSIVEKIINEHGGNIKVESTLGKGTKFTVRLPLLQPEDTDETS